MACNCNCVNSRCNSCKSFTPTTAVTVTGGNLVLTIPQNNYPNNAEVCIVITQNIPANAGNLPVMIQIGTATTLYPLRRTNGHNIYADQLSTRRIYCTRVASDSATFVYNGRCNLGCTSAVVPGSLPVTTVTTPATTV